MLAESSVQGVLDHQAKHQELSDVCKTEEIEVVGIVVQQWKPSFPGVRCDTSIVVHANNVARLGPSQSAEGLEAGDEAQFRQFWDDFRDRPLAGRNQIVQVSWQSHAVQANPGRALQVLRTPS